MRLLTKPVSLKVNNHNNTPHYFIFVENTNYFTEFFDKVQSKLHMKLRWDNHSISLNYFWCEDEQSSRTFHHQVCLKPN